MAALDNKYHIKIDGFGFMLSVMPRANRHIYGREEAPSFVNKFSSGDPNYRDSTFFPHWVQNNWLNGFDQEKFNDGGKFYRSSGVDITKQEKLKLQKRFFSAGQTVAGVNISAQDSWRTSASSAFGSGIDGALTISADTTDTPIDSACSGALGSTSLTATNASFAAGQKILIHQSQGTGAGNYQTTEILSYSAETITTKDSLTYAFVTGAQVLVMKQYTNVTVNSDITWTAKAWNGTVGGILTFYANGTVTVAGTIKALGFIGGANTDYEAQAYAGEGSVGATVAQSSANGSGGGGGKANAASDSYGAGGGGGNGGSGGNGNVTGTAVGGTGGGTTGTADLTTMTFGGAGGGGGMDQAGPAGAGGSGGGIIFIFGKTPTITGIIIVNGGAGAASSYAGGGGGAGGSILIKTQTAVLGTNLITATGGSGGTGNSPGGAGGVGRIAIHYSTSYTGTTNPALNATQDGTLTDSPLGSGFTHLVGTSAGKVYSWDGASTYTELFDTRRLEWFEEGTNVDKVVGDTAGVETAQAQSFKVDAAVKMKAIQVYLKKAAGTPGAITVRIETNSTDKPSGTLVDTTNATATIPAFTTATYGWITVEFPAAFALAAATSYWIVLKTAAAANDQNYNWAAKSTSGYADGTMAVSTNGGGTWTAVAAADAYFRVLGNETSVNCFLNSNLSGAGKIYIGTGNPSGTTNGDARLFSYDGTTFVLVKIFATNNEACILSMLEYGTTTKAYFALGAKAKIYSTTDFATFTLSKTITTPGTPGYVFSLCEYNGRLYATGGYPEQLPGNNYQYNGFLYSYDDYSWTNIYPFTHTVIKSLFVYDNLLFLGSINKNLYVYNTASMDKLLEFPWDIQISQMVNWDDKLALVIAPTPGYAISGHEGIYLFDRSGFHNAFSVVNRSWYSIFVFHNNLMAGNDDGYVYQTSFTTYQASGTLQMSYFEASLPSMDKLWRSVILLFESLPSGCSILVEYKTDESDASWTTVGTANTALSTSKEFTFAVAFYSKKLSLRLTLATTNSSQTPTIKVIDTRYVITPDFKYLWKFKIVCPDNIIWLDGTEPISITTAAITLGQTSLPLTDAGGFPTKGRAVVVDGSSEDEFTWTGKTSNTLTGVSGLLAHTSSGLTTKITGAMLHKQILTLKQAKTFYTFTDIDGLEYTVLFHQYQADDFVVNQTDGLENNVPCTLLES